MAASIVASPISFMSRTTDRGVHDVQHASVYDETADKTWFAFSRGSNYDPHICHYDHTAGELGQIRKIDNNPSGEAHGSPSMNQDGNGHLHVGYGGWGNDLKHAKTDNPRDQSSWTTTVIDTNAPAYHNIVEGGNGDLYFFGGQDGGTTDSDLVYYVSTDGGATWGAKQVAESITAGNWPSAWIYDSQRNAIHHLTTLQDDNGNWKGIYHWYQDLDDGHMYAMDGFDFGTSVSNETDLRNHAVIDEGPSPAGQTEPGSRIHLDSEKNPMVAYVTQESSSGAVVEDQDYMHCFARWNPDSQSWDLVRDIQRADQRNDAGDIVRITDDHLKWYLPNGDGATDRGGDIELYESTDGGQTWEFVKEVLSYDYDGANLIAPSNPRNNHPDIEVLFCSFPTSGSVDQTKQRMYAYGQSGFVTNQQSTPLMFGGSIAALDTEHKNLRNFVPYSFGSKGSFPDISGHRVGRTTVGMGPEDATLGARTVSLNSGDSVHHGSQDLTDVDDAHIGFLVKPEDLSSNGVIYSYWVDASNRLHVGYSNTNDSLWIRAEVGGTVSSVDWDWSPTAGEWYWVEALLGTNGQANGRVNGSDLSTAVSGSQFSTSFSDIGAAGSVDHGISGDGTNGFVGDLALGVTLDTIDRGYMDDIYGVLPI